MASLVKTDKISTTAGGAQEFTLPAADGTANQHLKTDGSGVLGWATPPTGIALTGSTNTWIPTITGADALTGTANFTYDGNTLDVKNGGTASSIKLYCESSNAHYQAIKAAPHSGSSDWTLTLPPTVPSVSGQALTATTAGVASWTTIASGLSGAHIWRITSGAAITANTDTTLTANWEQDDSVSAGILGSAMTQSSGVFTFPTTGIWLITSHMDASTNNAANRYMAMRTYTTINNSSYSMRAYGNQGSVYFAGDTGFGHSTTDFIFDVTDTANCKCYFTIFSPLAVTANGESDKNRTHVKFLRLGDT